MTQATGQAETCVIVMGQDCMSAPGESLSPEECEAIAEVFLLAAAALRLKQHGTITCIPDGEEILAEVGIDQGGGYPFEDDGGLPLLHEVKVKCNMST